MIVDDHAGIRKMIMSYLSDLVDEFVEFDDCSEVMASYATHKPDLVLMDIEMKHTDGLTATREIKKAFPEAIIVIVSQWESDQLRENARKAGADRYINKTNLKPLRDLLKQALGPGEAPGSLN